MTRYVFVGERPSALAHERGATWQNGGHAGKTLRDVLLALEVNPSEQVYLNLWDGPVELETDASHEQATCAAVAELHRVGFTIIAMGKKVERVLTLRGIAHTPITHPAARGWIRRRDRYITHVGCALALLEVAA